MRDLTDAYKVFGEGKDYESFKIGYALRQEHIDILEQRCIELEGKQDLCKKRLKIIENLERIFEIFLKHENSDCGHCLICDDMWSI